MRLSNFGDDPSTTGVPPTAELASVEECSQPAGGIDSRFVTTLLASVERCFHCVFTGTSPDGDKLRRGVGRLRLAVW